MKMGWEEHVAVIGSEMHAKWCCLSLNCCLWLTMLNLT